MTSGAVVQYIGGVSNNWDNYQNQIHKYLKLIENNPFVNELENDFKESNILNITKYLSKPYKEWVDEYIKIYQVPYEIIYTIHSLFNNGILLRHFCNYIEKTITIGDNKELKVIFEILELSKIQTKIISEIPVIKFTPSELKFVTTTGLAVLDTNLDFKYLYEKFVPPANILKSSSEPYSGICFNPAVINKVVGCKTGNCQIKGFFKKDIVGDFYNCATLQVVLGPAKCANIKLFNNGKLQLTGIPHPDLGMAAVQIVCDLIKSIPDDPETNNKIVFDKKRLQSKVIKQ